MVFKNVYRHLINRIIYLFSKQKTHPGYINSFQMTFMFLIRHYFFIYKLPFLILSDCIQDHPYTELTINVKETPGYTYTADILYASNFFPGWSTHLRLMNTLYYTYT